MYVYEVRTAYPIVLFTYYTDVCTMSATLWVWHPGHFLLFSSLWKRMTSQVPVRMVLTYNMLNKCEVWRFLIEASQREKFRWSTSVLLQAWSWPRKVFPKGKSIKEGETLSPHLLSDNSQSDPTGGQDVVWKLHVILCEIFFHQWNELQTLTLTPSKHW